VATLDPEAERLPTDRNGRLLAYGNGRSYGDSCLVERGTLLDARRLNRILDFDADTGRLRCGGGMLLAELLAHVVPAGWFLPVVPGTQLVTVGGAIANDIHGKNHHREGSFGRHVTRLALMRSDGTTTECASDQNPEWFRATIGGLGLTGLIRWADLQLRPIVSRSIEAESIRFGHVSDFFAISRESDQSHEYTVAWIDCIASGQRLGRGWFYRGNHSTDGTLAAPRRAAKSVSFLSEPPMSLVQRPLLKFFNAAYYHRPADRSQTVDYQPFFFPLDRILNWNRLYGPAGFYQFQCVVPPEDSETVMASLLKETARSGQGSFLAVLKVFGDQPSPGVLSFPRPGATLALDFANRGAPTLRLLAALEGIVVEAGGAIYPAKDLSMSPEAFQSSFPRWQELESARDPAFCSRFWRRVTGCE